MVLWYLLLVMSEEEFVSSISSSGGCWISSSRKIAAMLLFPGLPSVCCGTGLCRGHGVMVVWNRQVSPSTGTTMASWVISVASSLGMKLAQ